MDVESLHSPGDEPNEPELAELVSTFDAAHRDFISATGQWVRVPTQDRESRIADQGEEAVNAFYDVICKVVEDDGISSPEKAEVLAGLILQTQADRVVQFSRFIPNTRAEDTGLTQAELAEYIREDLEDDEAINEVVGKIMSDFLSDINGDVNSVFEIVNKRLRAKVLKLPASVRKHGGDVAKISAAVAIGNIATHIALRALDKNHRKN